jgi:hypothetical protein
MINDKKIKHRNIEEFKEKLKSKDFKGKIKIPTIWNTKVSKKDTESFLDMFNFSDEQVKRNTGTIEHIDTKIKCPKCKTGKMHRAYKPSISLFGKSLNYKGWLCQNEKCLHYIERAEIYKDWGHEYKEDINLEIEENKKELKP